MKGNEIRKGLTQKEMAVKFNLSLSTVKKYTSQPREYYESKAEDRRKQLMIFTSTMVLNGKK